MPGDDAALAELAAAGRAESAARDRTLRLAADLVARSRDGAGAELLAVEVAVALDVSTHVARTWITFGEQLRDDFPALGRALAAGDLDWGRTRAVLQRVGHVHDPAVRAEVEHAVLDRIVGACTTLSAVGSACDRVLASIDPELVRERVVRAEQDRTVELFPAGDGMAGLPGLLTVTDARTLDARLDDLAGQPCYLDPRTVAQRRADALVALTAGLRRLCCTCGRDDCASGIVVVDLAPEHPRLVVHVVVAAETLAGCADLPGVLRRLGVVDAGTVRRLAADATWSRLLTLDGTPVHLGRGQRAGHVPSPRSTELRYRPRASLAELVRDRDGHCRFPGCDVPAAGCDLDHVVPFDRDHPPSGGRTVAANLACLCRHRHRAGTAGAWAVTMRADGVQRWCGPSGQDRTTRPDGMPPTAPVRTTTVVRDAAWWAGIEADLHHAVDTHGELTRRRHAREPVSVGRAGPPRDEVPPF